MVEDLVTVIDTADTPANYALELIGARSIKEGSILERDFGTKHRFADYPPSRRLYDCFPLFDKTTQTLYYIGIFLDSSNNMSVWVYDPNAAAYSHNTRGATTAGWFELTASIVTTVSAKAANQFTAAATTAINNEVRYWIAVNTTRSPAQVVFITGSTSGSTTVCTTDANVDALGWTASDVITLYRNSATWYGFTAANGAYPHTRYLALEQLLKLNFYNGVSSSADGTPTMNTPLQVLKKTAFRNYFAYPSSNYWQSLPAGWFFERGGCGLIPTFVEVGSLTSPLYSYVPQTPSHSEAGISQWATQNILGSGTHFTTNLRVGQAFWVPLSGGGWEVRQVTEIDSDTSLYLDMAIQGTPTGTTYFWHNSGDTVIDSQVGANGVSDIADSSVIKWLQVNHDSFQVETTATTNVNNYLKCAITVLYNGYEESDPIWRGNVTSQVFDNLNENKPSLYLGLNVNFARMNKNISGFRIYAAYSDNTKAATFANWATADTDYILMQEIPLDSMPSSGAAWTKTINSENLYRFPCTVVSKDNYLAAKAAGATNLGVELGHAATWATRSYLTPRFGVSTARGGVGVVAVDSDDSTIRLSSYDGAGDHEDDNFPDLTVDNSDGKQKYLLQSLGEMIGMGISYGRVVVVKPTEIETIDLQSGNQNIIKIDTVARRGILSYPGGLVLPGRSQISILPADGSGIAPLNPLWLNRYDGTERTVNDALPRVSDAMRSGILTAFNPVYGSLWIYLPTLDADATSNTPRNLIYRYSKTGKWSCREIACGSTNTIACFITGTDNSFSIGFGQSASDGAPNVTSNGILKYPNLDTGANYTSDAVSRYEDCVLSNDTSSSKGITTKVLVNFGNLYSLIKNSVLWDFVFDQLGYTKRTFTSGQFEIKLYVNNEYGRVTFETKKHPFGRVSFPRSIPARGQIQSLMLEFSIDDATNLHKYKSWTISGLELCYLEQARMGNT